jgi:hypothetical protein
MAVRRKVDALRVRGAKAGEFGAKIEYMRGSQGFLSFGFLSVSRPFAPAD